MSLQFSVVIPTYHRPKELARCLLGALSQETLEDRYEIIVVDNDINGSAEKTIQKIQSGRGKIRYERRFSNNLSEARNLGARVAMGEWIAFLDDDCVPNTDWLKTAMELLQENRHPGLVFGGGYLENSEIQTNCSPQAIYLPKDKYLVEGNCFFRRSEYLAEGGMRADLGPSDKRFGYHEGSELQDRFLRKFGTSHVRILFSKLAVQHLESKKAKGWLSFVSGYDSAFAFRSSGQKKSLFNVVRIIGCLTRYLLHSIKKNPRGKKRELYRTGELSGELAFYAKGFYRQFTESLRLLNNKLLSRLRKEIPARDSATSENLRQKLIEKKPFLAGKIGGAELLALEYGDHCLRFEIPNAWSWRRPARRLYNNAGFFPVEKSAFYNWSVGMRHAIASTDFLCAWQADPFLKLYENVLIQSLAAKSCAIPMSSLGRDILPFIAAFRWVVVSPFVKTMQKQLPRMKQINDPTGKWGIAWDHLEKTCQFVRCPFQSHLESSPYASWDDGLEKLTKEISLKDFDLALIGAGAWSLPLGSRIKQMGKSAIHMGGEMQLIFGIKGKRWVNYNIYNSAWVDASPEEVPENNNRIEDGCYW